MKGREMVDQQVGGESSSKGYPLPVDPSSKCAFGHLTKSQASVDVCLPGSVDWESAEGRGPKLLEDSDIEMEMEAAGHGNGEQTGGVVESVKPRVLLPVMTQGIFNSVAITQLQDELEDTKKELDKQRATSVPLNHSTKENKSAAIDGDVSSNWRSDQCQDEPEVLRMGAIARETESKLRKAEEKMKGLAVFGQRSPNESFGNVLPGIQNSHGPPRDTTNCRQDLYTPTQSVNYQAPQAFAFGSPSALTNPFRNNGLANNNGSITSFINPFRNNGMANGDGQKRGCDETIQPEFGRDVKRVKREQF
ncbi:hypothetical protein BPAE_0143g00110 [Botrytis paeoniae]|uniref:Uncharacterized protein n=1 Tax=Botrytis paeoniae TaxID=278948 RepID=A0A4Z1FKE0_9HELO|nr:hypothetical protein BPAE_0143g00110 [Botrytis paeoniae]